jgi:signal transduction histidine kinase
MRERVLHALDLGVLGDWDGAKRTLEDVDDPIVPRLTALLTEQQRREQERAELQAVARHELGNAISIAQANVEALVDGVLEPTSERLSQIRDAMVTCGMLLDDLKKQNRRLRNTHVRTDVFDVYDVITAQVNLLRRIAESKNVAIDYDAGKLRERAQGRYSGDPEHVALIMRDVLLGAVRYTPPGGRVTIEDLRPGGELTVSVAPNAAANGNGERGLALSSKFAEALDGHASVVMDGRENTTVLLLLPVAPVQ